jgi:hypothetical protein
MALRGKLWAACQHGDTDLLIASLRVAEPIEKELESYEAGKAEINETDCAGKENGSISREEFLKCLNENVGENKETLLHLAAQGGHVAIIRWVYEGCLNISGIL